MEKPTNRQKISYKLRKTLQMHWRLAFTSFKGFPFDSIHRLHPLLVATSISCLPSASPADCA